jgi:hypothetical protein
MVPVPFSGTFCEFNVPQPFMHCIDHQFRNQPVLTTIHSLTITPPFSTTFNNFNSSFYVPMWLISLPLAYRHIFTLAYSFACLCVFVAIIGISPHFSHWHIPLLISSLTLNNGVDLTSTSKVNHEAINSGSDCSFCKCLQQ